jgi:serine/threonine-protein kinase
LTPDFWQQVVATFDAANALPPYARAAFLERECAGDLRLRSEVAALIDHAGKACEERFLDPNVDTIEQAAANGLPSTAPDSWRHRQGPHMVRVSFGQSSGPQPRMELKSLLQAKMRRGAMFILAVFGFFFVWDYAGGVPTGAMSRSLFLAHIAVLAAATVPGVFLLTGRPLPLWIYRATEILFIGLVVAFCALFQIREFTSAEWSTLAPHDRWSDALELTRDSCLLRWLTALVFYASVMPNTPRRAAVVLGSIAFAPLLLLIGQGYWEGTLMQMRGVVAEMAAWLAIGWALALSGSLKISAMESRAVESRRLGPYRLVKRLGAGGMGEVYLAEHDLLRRPCAVKLISPEQAGNPGTLQRFELEALATARLLDPNTVRVFDYGIDDDGTFYYVMEFLPGLSFQRLVELHGPIPPGRVVHYLRQVCSALSEAHAQGLIHRDIKPRNLMACVLGATPDVAKLLDFGLVRDITSAAQKPAAWLRAYIAGTPGYLAPEQGAGQRVDARSDIYSMGAVGHFLLTGRPPFQDASLVNRAAAAFDDDLHAFRRALQHTPSDLADVIARCLDPNPDNRFPDVIALDAGLAQCQCAVEWTTELARQWWSQHPVEK